MRDVVRLMDIERFALQVAGRCSRAMLDARGMRVWNDLRGRIVEIVVGEKIRSVCIDFTQNMLLHMTRAFVFFPIFM